jgi:hypothetical protein
MIVRPTFWADHYTLIYSHHKEGAMMTTSHCNSWWRWWSEALRKGLIFCEWHALKVWLHSFLSCLFWFGQILDANWLPSKCYIESFPAIL